MIFHWHLHLVQDFPFYYVWFPEGKFDRIPLCFFPISSQVHCGDSGPAFCCADRLGRATWRQGKAPNVCFFSSKDVRQGLAWGWGSWWFPHLHITFNIIDSIGFKICLECHVKCDVNSPFFPIPESYLGLAQQIPIRVHGLTLPPILWDALGCFDMIHDCRRMNRR